MTASIMPIKLQARHPQQPAAPSRLAFVLPAPSPPRSSLAACSTQATPLQHHLQRPRQSNRVCRVNISISQSYSFQCPRHRPQQTAISGGTHSSIAVSSQNDSFRCRAAPTAAAAAAAVAPLAPPAATAVLAVASVLSLMATVPGLLMVHAGLARAGSVRSTILSHFLAAALVAVLWSVCAYSLTFSTAGMAAGTINMYSVFGSFKKVLLSGIQAPEMLLVLHSLQGAIAAACIMLAGLVERIKLVPRLATVGLWLLVVYAPIMHATSAGPGSLLGDLGVVDSAGSLALHLAPAASALTAVKFCGGSGGGGDAVHNAPLAGIGFGFLVVGWIFHCVGAAAAAGAPVATAALNAQLSLSMSVLVWSSFDGAARCPSLLGVCFGAVSGLVAIMPACCHLNSFGALSTGFLAGFFAWLLKGQSSAPVQFPRVIAISSITGCLSAGLLSHPMFGGAQTSVVFATQAVVQGLCTLFVAAWAGLGSMLCLGVVIVLFRKVLLPEGTPGADVELVA